MATSLPPSSFLDRATWEQLAALVDGQDVSFLDRLYRTYLEGALEHLAVLRSDGAAADKRRAAHTLFGSSLSLGVTSIASACRTLERDLGRVPAGEVAERLSAIEAQLHDVERHYTEAVAELSRRRDRVWACPSPLPEAIATRR